ncbi:uncharacterized protein LOC116290015 [Actinia tenebrosa]|uniref:Uncharacterized protein LOC116290015 n=1 Tax=Actinia tenebrosa TaxID=6105 RepID=A0A6P8HCP4_ACTTE|nr:uncharacterized protein LOC116290015 [Actinia tenebrosa]
MPNRHVFTVYDPLAELKKHHANVFIKQYTMAERPRFRRQRSQTVPSIGNVQVKNSSSTTSISQARMTHVPVRQTRSLDFTIPNKTRPRSYATGQHTVSFSGNAVETNTKRFHGPRHSLSHSKVSTLDLPIRKTSKEESATIATRQTKSKSIPFDDKSSIYSIVKTRSLALKWYRGNTKTTSTKPKRKKSEPLPTINDKETISLCQAKCSPQFAEAMNLLQNDDNPIEEDIEGELSVLCLG